MRTMSIAIWPQIIRAKHIENLTLPAPTIPSTNEIRLDHAETTCHD